jgi:hypothetical protein
MPYALWTSSWTSQTFSAQAHMQPFVEANARLRLQSDVQNPGKNHTRALVPSSSKRLSVSIYCASHSSLEHAKVLIAICTAEKAKTSLFEEYEHTLIVIHGNE